MKETPLEYLQEIIAIVWLTRKAPNTTIAEFANTVDPDEMAHNEKQSAWAPSTQFAVQF